ncbi:MAG: histidinol-phosphatase [Planctomycetota bacterium]|nr:histidinol-phosphatase [Planctomycetota bacterium]MDA1211519.1 histidinol-phosphatase [Planctomycetota bacterium]
MDQQELQQRLEFALRITAEAEVFILQHYQSTLLSVDWKADRSPVTVADRGAEELLRERITREFPQDGVLGEEFGETASKNGCHWILDPIDGTKSFMHGVPLFGTLLALEVDGNSVLGINRFPALGEIVYAADGLGAWWQMRDGTTRPAKVNTVGNLSDALVCMTTFTRWDKLGCQPAFDALTSYTRLSRGWGDCYGYALVATGRAEIMVDPILNPWDAAPMIPILKEAGGFYVDWNGNSSIYSGQGVAVNSLLKEQVLEVLRPFASSK